MLSIQVAFSIIGRHQQQIIKIIIDWSISHEKISRSQYSDKC